MGANHNYFNTFWIPERFPAGTGDDTLFTRFLDCHLDPSNPLNGRLPPTRQLRFLNAYATAFFETYLKGEDDHRDVLTGKSVQPFASTRLNPQDVLISYHGPENRRLDINPFDSILQANVSRGFGTPVSIENINVAYVGGGPGFLLNDENGGFNPEYVLQINLGSPQPDSRLEPHGRGTRFLGSGMLRLLSGDQPGRIFHTADQADFTAFDAIQFRLGLPFETVISDQSVSNAICEARREFRRQQRQAEEYPDLQQEFPADVPISLTLVDADNAAHTIPINQFSAASFVPPGLPGRARLLLNQVRIPLQEFTSIDLTRVNQIVIEFAPGSDITLSDLSLISDDTTGL